MCKSNKIPEGELVTVTYEELRDFTKAEALVDKIEQAYGEGRLGILAVSGVPRLHELRRRLLPLAQRIAQFPDDVKALYEDPGSTYNFGWSEGKEAMSDGRLDTCKGSFYANPELDCPTTDAALQSRYPTYCRPNVWPTAHVPELEAAFKDAACMVVHVGGLVVDLCDRYLARERNAGSSSERDGGCSNSKINGGSSSSSSGERDGGSSSGPAHLAINGPAPAAEGTAAAAPAAAVCAVAGRQQQAGGSAGCRCASLREAVTLSSCHKGRLLHYFPPPPVEQDAQQQQQQQQGDDEEQQQGGGNGEEQDSWCGWHKDHGALTGLLSAMFLRGGDGKEGQQQQQEEEEVPCPDPRAGLYVRTRSGEVVKVSIPRGCVAYQMGEAMQLQSGGLLQATPHMVRAPAPALAQGVSRNTLAVFMQPRWDMVLDPVYPQQQQQQPADKDDGGSGAGVDVAGWRPGMTFGDFTEQRIREYYQ